MVSDDCHVGLRNHYVGHRLEAEGLEYRPVLSELYEGEKGGVFGSIDLSCSVVEPNQVLVLGKEFSKEAGSYLQS